MTTTNPAKMPANVLMAARRVIDLPGEPGDFGYRARAGLEEVCATRAKGDRRRYFRWTGWYYRDARGEQRRTVTCEPLTLAAAEELCDLIEEL